MFQFKKILPATVLAVAVLASPMAMADMPKHQCEHKECQDRGEWVEKHIAHLHDKLKITAQQEDQWKPVAQTLRDNDKALHDLMKDQHSKYESQTAPELLAAHTAFAEARLSAARKFADAFNNLYAGLTPDQKKIADECFRKTHGHHGDWEHHHDDK